MENHAQLHLYGGANFLLVLTDLNVWCKDVAGVVNKQENVMISSPGQFKPNLSRKLQLSWARIDQNGHIVIGIKTLFFQYAFELGFLGILL